MRCLSCGFENRPGLRFCENCGTVLQQETQPPPPVVPTGRFCPNCGVPNPISANFCKSCGFSFTGYAPPQNTYYPPQPRQSNSLNLLYILEAIGGMVLIAAVLFGIYLFMSGRLTFPITPQVVIVTQPPIVQPEVQQPAAPPQPIVVTATLLQQPIIVTATNPPQPIIVTATFTQTPMNPLFTATEDALCRAGPSKDFSQKAGIIAGQSAMIIGKSEPKWGDWWQVNYKGVTCWVWSDLGIASGNLGSVSIVVVQLPPTATFTPEFYSFFVFNNAGQDLCNLYRRYSGTTNWGQDLLLGWDGTWLAAGASRTWYFPAGKYDFRAIGCSVLGGYDRIIKNVTIPNAGGITFNP